MRHLIYKLSFTTAVHFGADAGGDHLTSVRMAFRSDTLFSALYIEALKLGMEDAFLQAVQSGSLCFSDALPRRGDMLFVPRPMGIFAPPMKEEDPSRRKLLKKVSHIPVEMLNAYVHGEADVQALHDASTGIATPFETTRVNKRDNADADGNNVPLPYRVAGYRFAEDCGLYCIVEASSEEEKKLMDVLMTALSAQGIGGKVSSGWGKFTFTAEDAGAMLSEMLENKNASKQLLLSTAYPPPEELETVLQGANYSVVRRGGFTAGIAASPRKKATGYLFGAGSTFERRFSGVIKDIGKNMPHPVYRCEKALFMGVDA